MESQVMYVQEEQAHRAEEAEKVGHVGREDNL